MDNSFFAYIQELELIAFFSGFPLIYAIILVLAGRPSLNNRFRNSLGPLLPYGYALTGTLYLGLILKNQYPDYLLERIEYPYLTIWGILAILFWIPAINKKTIISLMHSMVIFIVLIKNLLLQLTSSSSDINMVRNYMKIYTASLILNLGTFAALLILSFILNHLPTRIRS